MFSTVSLLAPVILQIKNLPKGATVIDYAYQIHTELGNNIVAAKVLHVKKLVVFSFFNLEHSLSEHKKLLNCF